MGAIGLGHDMSLINKQVLSEFLKYYLIVYRFIFGRKAKYIRIYNKSTKNLLELTRCQVNLESLLLGRGRGRGREGCKKVFSIHRKWLQSSNFLQYLASSAIKDRDKTRLGRGHAYRAALPPLFPKILQLTFVWYIILIELNFIQ